MPIASVSTASPLPTLSSSRHLLSGATSLYLDFWRLSAAMVVFLGHVSGQRFTSGLFWQLSSYMDQAVAIFFVLSGFVIAHATARQGETARSYTLSRLARLYSVALPALLLTFVLDAIGRASRPDLYTSAWGYVAHGQAWQFFSGLLLVNQLWALDVPQGSDLPYWSLGYEAWYYVIFGLAVFAPTRWRPLLIMAVLVMVGPSIAALLPLWLLGLLGYRICACGRVGQFAGWALCLAAVVAWATYDLLGRELTASLFIVPTILKRPSLVEDYIVGALFITHIIGFAAISPTFVTISSRVQKPIRWAAGATFTIYLLHLPIAQFLITQIPWPLNTWSTRVFLLSSTLLLLFAIAEVTERRKNLWRRVFEFLLFRGALRWNSFPDSK